MCVCASVCLFARVQTAFTVFQMCGSGFADLREVLILFNERCNPHTLGLSIYPARRNKGSIRVYRFGIDRLRCSCSACWASHIMRTQESVLEVTNLRSGDCGLGLIRFIGPLSGLYGL